ncbi:hypothetical protein Peternella1_48 [Winogradskyella phage Peternella_1]|uniref:DUF6046 domain-containing protein n=1 Tax=Winogradskyella phage Peternella_1 TaxID=2745699 RepID=A0A8E5EBN9_9CAUD|nr:baseplate hub [Winogradskyella phage Peternella_1]QQV91584.1 hypothetical protein Peternella1_48 [Winogradskyella phage Peternella_1]
MITYKPDISQLFNAAFGFIPITYKPTTGTQNVGKAAYASVPIVAAEEATKMSWMGTPIMFPVVFKGGTYQFYNANGELFNKQLSDFDLPPTTIVDFRQAKNVTKTNVLGANGTVKEIYGFDDWQIRIRGLCLDTPSDEAYDLQSVLLDWNKVADSIEVQGDLFLDKDIYRITIEEINFTQPQGRHNVIPFEITASSDQPLELVL